MTLMIAGHVMIWLGGVLAGWATRGLWIGYRYVRPTLRLADDAIQKQDLATAKYYITDAEAILKVL